MLPNRTNDSAAGVCTTSLHPRRRRHRRRSFYRRRIRPFRRELMTLFLLCLFVITTYLLWRYVAGS